MDKPKVELTRPLIDAFSCYTTFIVMGYDQTNMQTIITRDKIVFLFMFGKDERYAFVAAHLPTEAVAQQAAKDWRPALELWNTLPRAEINLMIATSRALEMVPPFLEFLSKKGHLPPLGRDGSSNNEFTAPCPYCQAELICQYDPRSPRILHPLPPCPDFLQVGGNGVMAELNRRGKFRMEGGVGALSKETSEPS